MFLNLLEWTRREVLYWRQFFAMIKIMKVKAQKLNQAKLKTVLNLKIHKESIFLQIESKLVLFTL